MWYSRLILYVEARERLTELRNKISNNERLEDVLDEVLHNTDQVRRLRAEAEHE
jgi:type VI secretion system protein ImpB